MEKQNFGSNMITKILYNIPQPVYKFYFFIIIVMLAIGELSYQLLKVPIVKQKSIEISSIAELKIQQISDFRIRRLHDAQLFHGNQTFIESVKEYIHNPDLKSEMEIIDWLKPIYKNRFYNDIVIYNPETKKNIFSFIKGNLELSAKDTSVDLKCLESDSIRFGDFTFNQNEDSIHLTIWVPLILRKDSSSEKIAVIKFFLDPYQKLYELMQSMPNSGRTGEILVVKRDGNDILYLNELRFRKNTALKFRLPITSKGLTAARALLGDERVSEGVDYRGVKVLAIARLIPDTDWSVVVKFDVAEIYSELKTLSLLILGMTLILIIASGFGLHTIWSQKKLNYYKLRVNDLLTIQRLSHVYKLLTEVEQAIVKHNRKEALLNEVCRIMANEGSYSLCWIGILNNQTGYLELIEECNIEKKYHLAMRSGITQKFSESIFPSGKIIDGKSFISNNLQTDFSIEELKENSIPEEFHSMAVIPLQQCSETIGAFYFYSNEIGFFSKEEVQLLERLSADLSFALDKIKQEEILKKSEQRFNSLVLASSEVFYRMSPDWSIMFQLNSRHFLSNTLKANPNWLNDYIHPDDQQFVITSINEAIQTKGIFNLEHRVLKADRTWGWTLSRAVPSLDENGEISEWFGTAIDLTRRKKAEEALRESEGRFSAIFRSNPNAIVLSHRKDGTIIDVNDAFLTLLGQTKEEIIGKTSYQLKMFSDPQDRTKAVAKLSVEGQVYNQELKIRRSSGEERTVTLSIVPLYLNGIETMVTTLQDITERKLMEEELRTHANEIEAILSCIADGVLVYDKEGRIVRSNFTADKILKHTNGESKLTMEERLSKETKIWSEDQSKLRYQDMPAFQSYKHGKTIRNQILLIQRSGDPQWVNISSAPLVVSGNHIGAVVSFSDITKLKKNEKALLESEIRLKELNATKDKLFSILSHDLRGPFTSIVGFSELLIENIRKKDFEDVENFAAVISESSHNAMNLLTNLIEWSRLQTGRINFNPAVFDINSIISEVLDLLFASAHQKSIIITSDVPSQINIFADRLMISTVLRNLISNAIKFSYPEGEILISAMQKEKEVMIKVSDNGVGMNKETIGKLFNFETNFSTPGTQNEMGTGLGMIICKEFVTKHNGKIWVESEIGKGSSIIFTIPL